MAKHSMARRQKGLHFAKRHVVVNMRLIKEILSWIFEILFVIFVAYLVVEFFCVRSNVVGLAMEPTLKAEDQILYNKFSYIVSKPKQGDVVLFHPNGNEMSYSYIRRVIACPGDTVVIRDGDVYVNGSKYELDFEVEPIIDCGNADEEITVKNDEYFVLGDNRNNSEDSRYANIGNVKKEHLIGKVWFYMTTWREFGFVR